MTQKKARWIRFIPPSDVGYESNETVVPFSPEAEINIKNYFKILIEFGMQKCISSNDYSNACTNFAMSKKKKN